MNTFRRFFLLLVTLFWNCYGQSDLDLDSQLESLHMSWDRLPNIISREKIYAIQNRHNNLEKKHEIVIGAGNQLLGNGLLSQRKLGINYSYYLNMNWAVKVGGTRSFNQLNDNGEILFHRQEILPDKDFSRHSFDVQAVYNAFYGKFRLSMERVFYFDQYFSLGLGSVNLYSGTTPMMMGDVGLSVWVSKNILIRMGLRNEWYREKRVTRTATNYNFIAHTGLGYLFGQH